MSSEQPSDLLETFLRLSGGLRPEYPESLGTADERLRERLAAFWRGPLPPLVEAIYARVSGTRAGIANQRLMDFVPGFRLIHVGELSNARNAVAGRDNASDLFPILGNYSSDFICVASESGTVCSTAHDDPEVVLLHRSADRFLATICEFYRRGVYFLDQDGYLDYDLDAYSRTGEELNPGVEYWAE